MDENKNIANEKFENKIEETDELDEGTTIMDELLKDTDSESSSGNDEEGKEQNEEEPPLVHTMLGDDNKEEDVINEIKPKQNFSEKLSNLGSKAKETIGKIGKKKEKEEISSEEEDIKAEEEKEEELNTLSSLEALGGGSRKRIEVNWTKILIIVLAIAIIVAGALFAVKLLNREPETTVATKEPTITVIEQISEPSTEQTGRIKRILSNKLLLSTSSTDTLYRIGDVNVSSLKLNDKIIVSSSYENGINILKEVHKLYTGKIIKMDSKNLTVTLKSEDSEETKDFSVNKKDVKKYKLEEGLIIEYWISNKAKEEKKTITIVDTYSTFEEVTQEEPQYTPAPPISTETITEDNFDYENNVIATRTEPNDVVTVVDFTDNEIPFYSGYEGPIWIRLAWRITNNVQTVPDISQIGLNIVMPNGTVINSSNIDKYGRYWVNGNIVNFALKESVAGDWKVKFDKDEHTRMGEVGINVISLKDFITIDKFGITTLDDDNIELIWNITGAEDDGLEMSVYLANNKLTTDLLNISSKTEPVHLIDKRIVNISNVPAGEYEVYAVVRDLDIKTDSSDTDVDGTNKTVTFEGIIHKKIVGKITVGGDK